MLSIDMLTMFSPLSSVRSALYACISTLCGALSCLRGAPSVQGSIHGLCIHFYYSRCYSVMFRPIMLVPMFRLVPGYPLVLPRSRYVPECITRSVLCSGVVRPRYLGRERRLVVLIVWGLTLCRRRSRRRLIPHLTGSSSIGSSLTGKGTSLLRGRVLRLGGVTGGSSLEPGLGGSTDALGAGAGD